MRSDTAYLTGPKNVRAFLSSLCRNKRYVGFDIETTALRPASVDTLRSGRVRLAQFYTAGRGGLVIDGGERGEAPAVLHELILGMHEGWLAGTRFIAWNGVFETLWMRDLAERFLLVGTGWLADAIEDAKLLYGALYGGNKGLEAACLEFLKVQLDKKWQRSNWHGPLDPQQLEYAIDDAVYTEQLWDLFAQEIDASGAPQSIWAGYKILKDAQSPVCEMIENGLPVDLTEHDAFVARRERYERKLDQYLVQKCPAVQNWNSPSQVGAWLEEVFKAAGLNGVRLRRMWPRTSSGKALATNKKAVAFGLTVFARGCDAERVLRAYKLRQGVTAILKTFGRGLANKVSPDGRLRGDYIICGAITGRMASAKPNMQNMPKDAKGFRRIFRAPPGRRLIISDYGQIELRVAALLAGEQKMLDIFIAGEDIHTKTAQFMFGLGNTTPSGPQRRAAKAINFGVIYGLQAPGLSEQLNCTLDVAQGYLDGWAKAYSILWAWKQDRVREMRQNGCLWTISGRRILVDKNNSPTVAANYPVQGSAGDVMYRALTRVRERLERDGFVLGQCPVLCAVVHDEYLLEVDQVATSPACDYLDEEMREAFLEFFPMVPVNGLTGAEAVECWSDKS